MKRRHVTWTATLVLGCALTVTACGPKGAPGGASNAPPAVSAANENSGPMGFPLPTAAYKATYQVSFGPRTGEITIYGSGAKTRVENSMAAMGAGMTSVTLMDRSAMQFVSFMEGPNAPKRATKLSADAIKRMDMMVPHADALVKPTKMGSDMVAGLACTVWQTPLPADAPDVVKQADPNGRQVCVTDDGIMLRVGAADKPRMLAVAVDKGAQDPSLFALPSDYQVVDVGDCMAVMQQYAQALRSGGPKPDADKLASCQKQMMGAAP